MRVCANCERSFPEVEGVDEQQCPHCGHREPTRKGLVAAAGARARLDPAGAAAHAFRFTREHYGMLLLLWAPAFLVDILGQAALLVYQDAASIPADLQRLSTGEQLRFLGVAFPVVLSIFAVRLAVFAAIAAFVADRVRPGAGRVIAMRPRAFMAIGLGFVLATMYLAGLVLFIVPFLIFFHWFLFAPAALADGARGIGAALDSSRRFAKERRTFGFTALTLFVIAGVTLAWFVLASVGAYALDAAGWLNDGTGIAVSAVASWLVAPVVAVVPASLYFLAKDTPALVIPVSAEATAAERFRTTKCPGCGTLVPYAATGSAVDVVCPVCGRAGRVL